MIAYRSDGCSEPKFAHFRGNDDKAGFHAGYPLLSANQLIICRKFLHQLVKQADYPFQIIAIVIHTYVSDKRVRTLNSSD